MIEAGRDRRGKKDVFYTWLGKVWLSGGKTHPLVPELPKVCFPEISVSKKRGGGGNTIVKQV